MSKNKKIKIAVFLSVFLILCCLILAAEKKSGQNKMLTIKGQKFWVELADDPNERALGLGKRKNICQQCGMLFLFEEKSPRGFWMKDMQFGLDILWVEDDRIVFIEQNISPDFDQVMKPPFSVDKVLELPAGTCQQKGIEIDDRIEFSWQI